MVKLLTDPLKEKPAVFHSQLENFSSKHKLDVIGIDEAQFFGDLYGFCCEAADVDGKTVVISGLDGDYLRRSFGSVLDVISLADTIKKLTARCEICGKRAFFTVRKKTKETQRELVGGVDVYMPVCREHYTNGNGRQGANATVVETIPMVQNDLIVS